MNIKKYVRQFVALSLGLLPTFSLTTVAAEATNVAYLDADGNAQTCATATVVESGTTTWNAGWYVVNSDVTIADRIAVNGDVHLILADGYTLTAEKGISAYSKSLTIYGQKNGTGSLVATGADYGIDVYQSHVTINGGTVEAETTGSNGIGIGAYGGEITVSGGTVTAIATGSNGIGIRADNGDLTVSGGTVEAEATSPNGIGIYAFGGSVTVSGGTVEAEATSPNGIGIYAFDGSVTVDGGGFVMATGSSNNNHISGSENFTNGIVFKGNDGKVYGTSVTLTTDAEIPNGKTLVIEAGRTLTIPDNVTLTNNGTIKNYGTINGTVAGNQPISLAANVPYIDPTKTPQDQTCAEAVRVESSTSAVTWNAGWYVVEGDVTIADRITVSGDVHLILADGATLTASKGIEVRDDDDNIRKHKRPYHLWTESRYW